jgi:uncharacterized protein
MTLDFNTGLSLLWVGFAIGTLTGMTGVGGGALMTPLLIVVFRMPPSIAIGTDLANAAIMKIAGAIQHWRQGTVKIKIVGALALGSLPAALLGVGFVKFLKDKMGTSGESVLTVILAWTLIFVATMMIVRLVLSRLQKKEDGRPISWVRRHRGKLTVLLGLAAGVFVSLTSIGAGSIVMVFLVTLYSASAKRLVGTDIVHAAALAGVAALGHLWAGDINFGVAGLLLIGSLPGVILGSRISLRMPEVLLRFAVALVLIFSGMRLIIH